MNVCPVLQGTIAQQQHLTTTSLPVLKATSVLKTQPTNLNTPVLAAHTTTRQTHQETITVLSALVVNTVIGLVLSFHLACAETVGIVLSELLQTHLWIHLKGVNALLGFIAQWELFSQSCVQLDSSVLLEVCQNQMGIVLQAIIVNKVPILQLPQTASAWLVTIVLSRVALPLPVLVDSI